MTNVTALPRRIRAGAPAPVDTRQQCRLSSEVIGELIQAGAHRRNALAANHTMSPPEREFARHDRDPKAKATFWRIAFLAYVAVIATAVYFR